MFFGTGLRRQPTALASRSRVTSPGTPGAASYARCVRLAGAQASRTRIRAVASWRMIRRRQGGSPPRGRPKPRNSPGPSNTARTQASSTGARTKPSHDCRPVWTADRVAPGPRDHSGLSPHLYPDGLGQGSLAHEGVQRLEPALADRISHARRIVGFCNQLARVHTPP